MKIIVAKDSDIDEQELAERFKNAVGLMLKSSWMPGIPYNQGGLNLLMSAVQLVDHGYTMVVMDTGAEDRTARLRLLVDVGRISELMIEQSE